MILDILFTDKGPSQYQDVRLTTIYTRFSDGGASPEVVLHFTEIDRPQLNIPLARIIHIQVTND